MLMMADAGGDVHPLLPLDTLERYRVDAGRLRNATLVRRRLRVGLTRKAYTQGAVLLTPPPPRGNAPPHPIPGGQALPGAPAHAHASSRRNRLTMLEKSSLPLPPALCNA